MKTSIIAAIFIALLLGGAFFAWSQIGKQISLPGKTLQIQPTATPSPTPTPTPIPSLFKETKKTPTTGVNLLLPLIGSVGLGLTGWYLLKKV